MGAFKFLLLLLTFLWRVTVLLSDSDESVIEKVEGMWQQAQLILNVSDVYERVEMLPDNVEPIVDMFASFGELFINGTLGECFREPHWPYEPCFMVFYGNGSRALKRKVIDVLKALAGLEGTRPFATVIQGSKYDKDLTDITIEAKNVFYDAFNCYNYIETRVVDAINSSLDEGISLGGYMCSGRVAEEPAQWEYGIFGSLDAKNDRTINNALREIGPNCSLYDKDRKSYDEYADKHELVGGDSNRCLQNFVVRASQYDQKTFKAFLAEVHKYLFQDVQQTTLTTAVVEGIVTDVMHKSDIDKLLWKERPSRYIGLIKKIVYDLKREYSNFSSEGGIEGVMYLPYAKDDRRLHCVLKLSENENQTSFYERQGYKGADIFISWTESPYPSDVLNSRIALIRSHESAVWDAIFGDKTDDLCKNVRTAASDPKLIGFKDTSDRSEFNAVVAIRCAYEFVWYELGWRYYEAAATTNDYVLSRHAGEYNSGCGQLIFLP